jgi:hypothetical protein
VVAGPAVEAVGGPNLRTEGLLDPKVRDAIRKFEGGKVTPLYESGSAVDYV